MKGDHAYFAAIWKQMEAGGYAAMLHDLLALDLTTFNVRAVPTTEGLQRQRKLSLQTTEAWWLDCLERGYVFRSRLGLEQDFAVWHDQISTELLFSSYSNSPRLEVNVGCCPARASAGSSPPSRPRLGAGATVWWVNTSSTWTTSTVARAGRPPWCGRTGFMATRSAAWIKPGPTSRAKQG